MAENEKKAHDLIEEAEKKLKPSLLGTLFGGNTRLEDAAALYIRAANLFKMAKRWQAAGQAFCQSALLQQRMQSRHESASNYIDAGTCYRKVNAEEAVNCYNKAIEIYTDMGRFTIAAKHNMTIAEMYEVDALDIEKAIYHYSLAADYYKGEESTSAANKCLLKCAEYSATLGKLDRAIEIYEQVGTDAMSSPLLKYSAKDYFFRAALCHLCVDALNATLSLNKYAAMFPQFEESRECKLIRKLSEKVEENDADGFAEAVQEYDSISRLDKWYTAILLRIKKDIEAEPDLR